MWRVLCSVPTRQQKRHCCSVADAIRCVCQLVDSGNTAAPLSLLLFLCQRSSAWAMHVGGCNLCCIYSRGNCCCQNMDAKHRHSEATLQHFLAKCCKGPSGPRGGSVSCTLVHHIQRHCISGVVFSKCCIKCSMTAASCKRIPRHSSHLELHVLPDLAADLVCCNPTRKAAPSLAMQAHQHHQKHVHDMTHC